MGTLDQASDGVLLKRIREGDADAYRALFGRYSAELAERIERWLPRGLRRKVSVSDVLQETQLVAFQRLPEFVLEDEEAVRRWLTRVAHLRAQGAVKRYATTAKRAAAREVSRGNRADTGNFPHRGPSPSQAAANAELTELAGDALNALSGPYQDVIRMALEEGLTLREVAARMGRTRDAVKKLYGRAVTRLTKEFHDRKGYCDA